MEEFGSVQKIPYPDPGGPKLTDPDPEQCNNSIALRTPIIAILLSPYENEC
jgi:hypothetical protein